MKKVSILFVMIIFSFFNSCAFMQELWSGSDLIHNLTNRNNLESVKTPVFSLSEGYYPYPTNIIISCETKDATLIWSSNNGTAWNISTELFISNSVIIFAKANKSGMLDSALVQADYLIPIFIFDSSFSNITESLGLTIFSNLVTNSPPTYFSNFIVSNGASHVYVITNITNAVTNGFTAYKITNVSKETNYEFSKTNLLEYIPVLFNFYSLTTNHTTNGFGVLNYTISNYPTTYYSNYLITNEHKIVRTITYITNAKTNSVLIYNITNEHLTTNTVSATTNITVYYPPIVFTSPTNNNIYYGTINISGVVHSSFDLSNLTLNFLTNGIIFSNYSITPSSGNWSTNWSSTNLPVGDVDLVLVGINNAQETEVITNRVFIRPYITSFSTSNTLIGSTIIINGHNFGSGIVSVQFNGATAMSIANNGTNVTVVVPTLARSGYLNLTVNGINTINSNWIDLWNIIQVFNGSVAQINSKFTLGANDKYYFVQGNKNGTMWASNFLLTDYSGSLRTNSFGVSSIANGEIPAKGVSIDVRGTMVAIAYSPLKQTGIWVTVFTNNGATLSWIRNTKVDITTLGSGDELLDIKIDNNYWIHLVYSDFVNGALKYAKSTNYGASWSTEVVISELTFDPIVKDAHASIDIDSSGYVHIVYYDYTTGNLKHADNTGGNWNIETVDSLQNNGLYSDLKIDPNDAIHVSYYNIDGGDLCYSYKNNGGSWNLQMVDFYQMTGQYTSIDIRESQVAISYFNNSLLNAWLSYYDGSTWRSIPVPQYGGMNNPYGKYGACRFSESGNEIWVGFVSSSPFALWIAKYIK